MFEKSRLLHMLDRLENEGQFEQARKLVSTWQHRYGRDQLLMMRELKLLKQLRLQAGQVAMAPSETQKSGSLIDSLTAKESEPLHPVDDDLDWTDEDSADLQREAQAASGQLSAEPLSYANSGITVNAFAGTTNGEEWAGLGTGKPNEQASERNSAQTASLPVDADLPPILPDESKLPLQTQLFGEENNLPRPQMETEVTESLVNEAISQAGTANGVVCDQLPEGVLGGTADTHEATLGDSERSVQLDSDGDIDGQVRLFAAEFDDIPEEHSDEEAADSPQPLGPLEPLDERETERLNQILGWTEMYKETFDFFQTRFRVPREPALAEKLVRSQQREDYLSHEVGPDLFSSDQSGLMEPGAVSAPGEVELSEADSAPVVSLDENLEVGEALDDVIDEALDDALEDIESAEEEQAGGEQELLLPLIDRSRRARMAAADFLVQHNLEPSALTVISEIFNCYGWSRCRTSLEVLIQSGASIDDIELAFHLRRVWAENDKYSQTLINSELDRAYAAALSWPTAIHVINSFDSQPTPFDVELFVEEAYEHWVESRSLRSKYPTFSRYLYFRVAPLGAFDTHRNLSPCLRFDFVPASWDRIDADQHLEYGSDDAQMFDCNRKRLLADNFDIGQFQLPRDKFYSYCPEVANDYKKTDKPYVKPIPAKLKAKSHTRN